MRSRQKGARTALAPLRATNAPERTICPGCSGSCYEGERGQRQLCRKCSGFGWIEVNPRPSRFPLKHPDPPAKPSKHRSRKTVVGDLTFDSAKEASRYSTLKLWQQVGAIRDLRLQVSYDLYGANGERVARYVADFVYVSLELGREVVEDVKSPHTRKLPVYRLKLKLLRAQGIQISEA